MSLVSTKDGGDDEVVVLPSHELDELDELIVPAGGRLQGRPSGTPPPVYPEMGIRLKNRLRPTLPPLAPPESVTRVLSAVDLAKVRTYCTEMRAQLDALEQSLGLQDAEQLQPLTELRLRLSRLEATLGLVSDHA